MQVDSVPRAVDNAAADEFISRVSHDLRTPLAAIKAAIGVVLANEPEGTAESLRRMFRNIDRATDQMNSMIANMAETVKLRSGKDALHCELIDLNDVARRAARITELGARRQNQAVETHIVREPCFARADASRIERALLNLLENAQKYAPTGGTIRFSLDARDSQAIFSVADNGPGIPDGSADRILNGQPAQQGGSGKPGLGLPVARTIAELHGGRLWIDTDDASVFHLAVPTTHIELPPANAQSRIEDGNE